MRMLEARQTEGKGWAGSQVLLSLADPPFAHGLLTLKGGFCNVNPGEPQQFPGSWRTVSWYTPEAKARRWQARDSDTGLNFVTVLPCLDSPNVQDTRLGFPMGLHDFYHYVGGISKRIGE